MGGAALYEGGTDTLFANNRATDGDYNPDNDYFFGPLTSDIYIDLGSVQAFGHVLFYNLGVSRLHDAVVTVTASTDNTIDPDPLSFTTGLGTVQGDWEFDNWLYVDAQGATARWIHVEVERFGTSGANPEFEWVSEIRVVGQ